MNNVDHPFKSPNVLSLCTGMRGLERGIERAIGSVNTIAYVEIEAFIIENLVKQMEQGVLASTPIFTNLKTFPWNLFRGKIHGITGGYPCQPFSIAGKQKGAEDPRHLWPFIKEGVTAIRPVWCFFENVPGHINIGYREVQSDLEQLGYRVKEGIFSAEEVGAPHQRKRLFIFAIRLGVDLVNAKIGWARGLQDKTETREGYGASGTSRISTGVGQANSCSARNEVGISEQKQWEKGNSGIIDNCSNKSLWPAHPGSEQFLWEQPRTKPKLGFTINGYNFREDLLRMAGNGVVEQTAELAFLTLLQKHQLHYEQNT